MDKRKAGSRRTAMPSLERDYSVVQDFVETIPRGKKVDYR